VHTILYKHSFEEAPRVSGLRQDIPRYLSDAIQRALAKEPGQRFASMEEFATAVWPEQPVTATGKVTPRPAVRGARGPVTADTPTEQVATAAARTTPMPQAAGGRPRPGLTAPPTHPRASPPSRKSSSRAGVLVFLGVLVAAAGGYIVMRGSGEGEPGSSTGAGAAPAPPNLATPGVASAQSTAVGVSRSETTATAAASSSAVVTPPAAQPAPPSAPRQPGPQPTRRPARQTPAAKQPVVQAPPVVEPPPAQPVAPEGYLTIDADPFGTVFVDGVNVGTTPVVRHVVKPGAHQIRIESPGYKTVVDRVTVDSGNTVRRRYPLTPEG
jgi:serine/threonine-protein kinase